MSDEKLITTYLIILFQYCVLKIILVLCLIKGETNISVAVSIFLGLGFSMIGSIIYCMRSLYITYCVQNKDIDRWMLWYVLRPFVGAGRGLIFFMIVLDIQTKIYNEITPLQLLIPSLFGAILGYKPLLNK